MHPYLQFVPAPVVVISRLSGVAGGPVMAWGVRDTRAGAASAIPFRAAMPRLPGSSRFLTPELRRARGPWGVMVFGGHVGDQLVEQAAESV